MEYATWWSPSVRLILSVSDSIAEEVRSRSPAGKASRVLPYSYDETRFHPGVRAKYREAMRTELGLSPKHFALVFVSQGHYQRKGFWLAVEALSRVRHNGQSHIRLIVVGGTTKTVHELQTKLAGSNRDWGEWIIFVGMQNEVERYYAAADAFIFPSYFETYSLVAMEAAATGLPVLLTPFHGSEMTLVDGVNGRLLSYDSQAMSEQLTNFIQTGLPPFPPTPGRGLSRAQYAAALLEIYEEALHRKSF